MFKNSLIFLIFSFYSFKLIESTRVIADDRFLEECLHAHNKYRDLHENTPRLKLNRSATEYALNRVMSLAKMEGSRGPSDKRVVYGENFYWYYDAQGYHTCKDAVDVWYNGINKYNYNRPGFSESSGGFSQVVWRGSQNVGCALIEQDKNAHYPETFIVCNYWPAGNVDGQYPYHVYPIKEREPSRPGGGGANRPGDEWSDGSGHHRPGTGNRPDDKPGNRPGSGGNWNDRPGDTSGTWPAPSRPGSTNQNQGGGRPRPPSPPSYPLILLHPII